MRLLWAQDAFWPDMRGGGETKAYCLVTCLARLGHKVDVLTRQTVPTGREHAVLGAVPIYRFETPKISDHLWRMRAWLRARQWKRILSRFLGSRHSDYDGAIVFGEAIVHYLRRARPGMRIVMATGGTWYGSKAWSFDRPHGSLSMRIAGQMSFAQYYAFERLGHRAADYIVPESRNVREQLMRLYHVTGRRVSVIGNGVDHNRFAPRPESRSRIRQSLGWPSDAFVVIGVGRLDRVKNYEYFIRSIALAARKANVLGVIAGEGNQRNVLQSLIEQLKTPERIRLMGLRSDVPELLSACDAFLLPSMYEAYGLSWVEAMSTGLPCLGLRREFGIVNSAAEEHITHGVTGYLVDHASPADCAARLIELADRPELARRMGEAARQIALEQYRWDLTAKKYVALIESLPQKDRTEKHSEGI